MVGGIAMPSPSAKQPRPFPVYDNMFYIGKPDTTQYGLIPSNIIDEGHIWPHGQKRQMGHPRRDRSS
jgi:hypothetical protein